MRSLRSLPLVGVLALLSCTSSTEAKRATTIVVAPIGVTFYAVGDLQALTATVLDQNGSEMTGQTVTWSSSSSSVAAVNPAGTVTATGAGTARIRAVVGSAKDSVTVVVDQVPDAFAYGPTNNGNGLSSPRGTAVTVRPAVQILDANGNGVPGETVNFAVTNGGGSIGAGVATTDGSGIARVQSWTLGPNLGTNTLEASFGGFTPVVFTVTGIENPCVPAGATVIALGETKNGSIENTDCLAGDSKRYDLYKFELASPSGVVFLMDGTQPFDSFLILLASDNATQLAFDDDIVDFVNQDSRIGIQLAAGTYFLRTTSFSVGEVGNYSLSAEVAAVGVPASLEVAGGQNQLVAPGSPVGIAPSVLVRDILGDPVAGTTVTFSAVGGLGAVTGASAVTNASGVATVGSWTLATGTNVLAASVVEPGVLGNPAAFSATGNASAAGFDILVRFTSVPTGNQLTTFNVAVAKWESIITGDLAATPVNVGAGNGCGLPAINETIDDLIIYANLEPIDGVGNILGAAGPCFVRATTATALLGVMTFDTADLANMEANGTFNNVILHEMGHVIGIGTLWDYGDPSNPIRDLLKNPSSSPGSLGLDTHMSGVNAIAGFNAIGGSSWTGGPGATATSKVPVENQQGGAGTLNAHWRESVLQSELMTGFVAAGSSPLSQLTVRSLVDIGYTVDVSQADPFFVALSIRDAGSVAGPGVELKDDILRFQVLQVDPDGRVRGVTRRK